MKKIADLLSRILIGICAFCMISLTVVVLIQIVNRQLKVSLAWTDELARFLMIWLTFSGSAVALYKNMHLAVKYFVNLMPDRLQNYAKYFVSLLIIVFQSILVIFGVKLSVISMKILSPTLNWSNGIIYLMIPFTSIISIYLIVYKTFFEKEVIE